MAMLVLGSVPLDFLPLDLHAYVIVDPTAKMARCFIQGDGRVELTMTGSFLCCDRSPPGSGWL